MSLTDEVRESCARIAASATHVRIDETALGAYDDVERLEPPPLDPERHWLEGEPADVADWLLQLGAVNFGSGWFPTLRKREHAGAPVSGYFTVAWALADRARANGGPWTNQELRRMTASELAGVLGQPADHELMALYAQALRELGRYLGERRALDVAAAAKGSAVALASDLAGGMAMFDDRGFYKRAQIVGSDLAAAGLVQFIDLDRLTIFADNLVPHVLRCDGVLRYDDELAAWIDAGRPLPMDVREREIRGCAVHACELLSARLGLPAQTIDHWLWNRGQAPGYKAHPRHRTRCVFY